VGIHGPVSVSEVKSNGRDLILSVEQWVFLDFLYIIGGAVNILFASHVLVPDAVS
jgi:hypothetical protein